jgi:hypothetical protein
LTLTSAYETEEDICNLASAVISFIWNIFYSNGYTDDTRVELSEQIKEHIDSYEQESRLEVAKLHQHAQEVGIQLLSISEYEEILTNEGSTNPIVLTIGEITIRNGKTPMTDDRLQTILAFCFGTVFVSAILAIVVFVPNPTSPQFEIFRLVIALAAGGVAAVIPGLLNLQMKLGCVRDACNFSRPGMCPAKFTLLDGTIIV